MISSWLYHWASSLRVSPNCRSSSDIFEIEAGVSYKKTLRLEIPDDMDANDDYTLYVEIYDDDNEMFNMMWEDYKLKWYDEDEQDDM